ncbi:MAG: flavodoxin domain-containing protein [Oenococcus sp.]|uniref:flavodoxin domain-containing protein n=1 Tax=Oenococcus sp. TaxID=1979414 RepID=UPI0039EA793C
MQIDIIYTTITGNSETIVTALDDEFFKQGYEADIHEFEETELSDLNKSDIVVIVPYTYDKGTVPDESMDFFDDLNTADWSNKVCGVIGSGDKFYGKDYGKAVEKFANQVKKAGANLATAPVKIQLAIDDDDLPTIHKFVSELLAAKN